MIDLYSSITSFEQLKKEFSSFAKIFQFICRDLLKLLPIYFIIFLLLGFSSSTINSFIINDERDENYEWEVMLNFYETSGKTDYVIFGEATDAYDGPPHDSRDIPSPPPPPYPPYIDTWLDDNLGDAGNPYDPYHKLIEDFRHYPDINKTWNLTVKWVNDSDIGTNITITWDINEFDFSEYTSVLLFRKNQITEEWIYVSDMLSSNNFSYSNYKIWIEPPGFWYWFLTDEFKVCASKENEPPIAHDDSYNTNEDVQLFVSESQSILMNDFDTDGPLPLVAILDNDVSHGDLLIFDNGSFIYTPNENFSGIDFFTYMAYDGANNSNIATVTINVDSINDDPIAIEDTFLVDENSYLNVLEVIENDFDVDGDDIEIIGVTSPYHGDAIFDESYVYYTPNLGYSGYDNFTYKITDNNGSSEVEAPIYINIEENSAPNKPTKPSGQNVGKVEEKYMYNTSAIDVDDDQVYYMFSWGDGNYSDWIGTYDSGEIASLSYSWKKAGVYEVKSLARDEYDHLSDWSEPLTVSVIDDKPPTVEILKPSNHIYICNRESFKSRRPIIIGKIDIEIFAEDNESDISRVEVYINDKLKTTLNQKPYTFFWEERLFIRHTLKVKAFDNFGNYEETEIKVVRFF